MQPIKLTSQEMVAIRDMIDKGAEECGHYDWHDIDDIRAGVYFDLDGWYETNGYREEETGAFVETYRDVSCNITAFDEEGNDIEIANKEEVEKFVSSIDY